MRKQIRSQPVEVISLTDAIGFFSWNVQENKVYSDKVFAYVYGVDPHMLASGAPIELVLKNIDDGDLQRVAKALHETIITGEPCNQSYGITHPDGRKITVTGQGRCLRDGAGVPSIYTGSVVAAERGNEIGPSDPLESHCLQALNIAKSRRHALAARYLSSALNALGRKVDF
ncbi:hypothetical protein [Neorhizobium alkalisoli]|uniref:PAS domain-containing protein n=1 Tax=Neorhizobium alkalisoli TaxID=528178 RepID=A0A561R2Q3_9HYPH|nr:hypothetical protein [Neorhizobium alkalisoli]TWF56898.1 hypothetical protein FHW37_102537 [Neorhizobium alkalisoli]